MQPGPLEHRLNGEADRRGWRLRWLAEPVLEHPSVTMTSLDVLRRRKLVNVSGPITVGTAGAARPREIIADMVLSHLEGRNR